MPAAVLLPLRLHHDAIHVVFTRRSSDLSAHPGQVAFPGGRLDPSDASPTAAALREAYEELAIPPERVQVLGRLDDFSTVTDYHVVPIVGLVEAGVTLVPQPREVVYVFDVPLEKLLDAAGWEQRLHAYQNKRVPVWHFVHGQEDIWGVTGQILHGFVELLWGV